MLLFSVNCMLLIVLFYHIAIFIFFIKKEYI